MNSRTGWSRSTPDYDGTGTGVSEHLGQKGHVVALVVTSSLSITLHHQTFHGPGDHRLVSVHVYSVLICTTGSQSLKPVSLSEGPLIPPTPIPRVGS